MSKESPSLDRLPIKVVLPHQGKERRVPAGGSPPKPLQEVTPEVRSQLSNSVKAIKALAAERARRVGSVPVRVKLIPKAMAKSHRPDELFARTCPIVGAGALGELFLRASPEGLERLAEELKSGDSQRLLKDISTIQTIEPVTPTLRRSGLTSDEILKRSPRSGPGFATRVRLFDYGESSDQSRLVSDFLSVCSSRRIAVSSDGYSASSHVYAVECRSSDDVEAVSSTIGVRSISRMPVVRMIRPRALNTGTLPPGLTTRGQADEDVPVVVVVDSGITDKIPALNSWVVGRQSDVAPKYRNSDHGTFVAGLIVWGDKLNPHLPRLGDSSCAVFDLQVMPNTNPARGDIGTLGESELLQSLDTALKQLANHYKVWNLSLGTDELCSTDEFSELAKQLDDLQEKYQVTFVISAGNFDTAPLLDYPRTGSQITVGRITAPADSVLGVTVGSVSHIDYARGGPRLHCPSAFSRHGAGPNHIIKPDLVHYGGSCSTDNQHQVGIRSVYDQGTAEDLGTSFAAPLVARSLAQIVHQVTPAPSPVLARALLTHHARDPRHGGRVPDGEENFLGFGMPDAPPYCLECTPYASTLVFEDTLRPGFFLEWDDFPYPPSLHRDGRFYGEVWMTVALAPSRGARWGTEYCESHIDAHFGVYYNQVSRMTGEVRTKFRGLVPPEHKNKGILYESYQVEKLRKWAPVRTYHGDLSKGERGARWRLMVRLLTRHGIDDLDTTRPQPFALILTVADPKRVAPVYDDMARSIRSRFKVDNLTIRPTVRVRTENRET